MHQRVSAALAGRRFLLFVVGVLAVSAFALAAVGLYAVLAHMVSQGRHEIGIRMALGAQPSDVLCGVLRHGLALTGIALVIGLAIALAGARVLSSLLYEISPTDPLTLGGVAAAVGSVALLACYLPARRATKVDPMAALRCE